VAARIGVARRSLRLPDCRGMRQADRRQAQSFRTVADDRQTSMTMLRGRRSDPDTRGAKKFDWQ